MVKHRAKHLAITGSLKFGKKFKPDVSDDVVRYIFIYYILQYSIIGLQPHTIPANLPNWPVLQDARTPDRMGAGQPLDARS